MEYITYFVSRRCVTGVMEYLFFRNDHPLGTASAFVLPQYPVTIRGAGLDLRCECDPEITLISGISRGIYCGDNTEYARIFWDGNGKHRLHTSFGNYPIEYQEGVYAFGRDDICIAGIGKIQNGAEYDIPLQDGWEPCFAMMTTEQLPDALALLMLSFPLLQIGP